MARNNSGLFRKIVLVSLLIIVGSALAARSETAMEFLAEYDIVITLAITLIFVVGFFIRWRYKE